MRRPAAEPVPSRTAQQKQHLLELENEQRLEDAEALKFRRASICSMPLHEQRPSLFLSFRSVKFEWSDLDGMRSVRRRYNSSCPASPPPSQATRSPYLHPQTLTRDPIRLHALPLPPHAYCSHSYSHPPVAAAPEAFAVRTNAHLASFGKDDTICLQRPSYTSPSAHSTHAVAFPVSPQRYASAPTPAPTYTSMLTPPTPPGIPTPPGMVRRRVVPTRACAHVGGEAESEHAGEATLCPIRVPLPPLVSVDGEAPEEDDEDAWVDEDEDGDDSEEGEDDEDGEMTVVDDWECGGDEELPTPVPWRADLLAPRTPPALSVDVHVGAPPAYYESEGEGEEPQTPVPGLYSREATPTPYSREEEREREGEGEREGEQVGGETEAVTSASLAVVSRHVTTSPRALCCVSSLSRNTVSTHPARSLARHDPPTILPSRLP
ncbi:hypothetical protein B0H14DRAFT_3469430 [Mycena olivaceomarginata]|nr:hypothetical protein B0H14DRAFT_3469430 [Mycena olivaceomarginata]